MQRVFTQDIHKSDGTVKYKAGSIGDFPHATWNHMARGLSMELDDFTALPEEVTAAVAQARRGEAGERPASPPPTTRRRSIST